MLSRPPLVEEAGCTAQQGPTVPWSTGRPGLAGGLSWAPRIDGLGRGGNTGRSFCWTAEPVVLVYTGAWVPASSFKGLGPWAERVRVLVFPPSGGATAPGWTAQVCVTQTRLLCRFCQARLCDLGMPRPSALSA